MLTALLLGLIRFYRKGISPIKPPTCRFSPTCSAYAAHAIEGHGPFRGGWLALKRILRCHPFGGWGYDPVPPARTRRDPGRLGAGVESAAHWKDS